MISYLNLFLNSYTFKVVTIGCSLLAMISAIIGNFAVLKKESLLGDGVAHASLAGVCMAFLLTGRKEMYILLLGALIVGLICISLIHYIQIYSKIKFDSAIAMMLSSFFGFGLVLLTYLKKIPGAKKAGLNRFIFGQASTLVVKDIYFIVAIGLLLLFMIILFWKEIKISIFDKEYAKTLGIDSDKIRFMVSVLLVINIILGIQIAGVILITAMIIAPAVAARQWSDKLLTVVIISAIFGFLSGAFGSIISTLDTSLPTGPLIVVISSFFVIFSLVFSVKEGIVVKLYKNYKRNKDLREKQLGGGQK
ncbi:MAG: metal ABC transporter permease [Fusobacterium sp.]|uniref:metal ABC transporter permease n=1 Tax=Fusobacterium sp. TaxID=68766 RepID=UPI0026DCD716|nr:metal ABC transporter permease [Fusobacterium sp.]MDO4690930.1 metal ABC transporter permease [Fusobacterium sp.]